MSSSSGNLRCNLCWNKAHGIAYSTRCGHFFCQCFEEKISAEPLCPACERSLTKKDVCKIDLESTPDAVAQSLCGLPPDFLQRVHSAAINFYIHQQSVLLMREQFEARKLSQKLVAEEKRHAEETIQLQARAAALDVKLDAALKESEAQKAELLQLQERFSDKCREKSKLQELYNSLKRKHDDLSNYQEQSIPSMVFRAQQEQQQQQQMFVSQSNKPSGASSSSAGAFSSHAGQPYSNPAAVLSSHGNRQSVPHHGHHGIDPDYGHPVDHVLSRLPSSSAAHYQGGGGGRPSSSSSSALPDDGAGGRFIPPSPSGYNRANSGGNNSSRGGASSSFMGGVGGGHSSSSSSGTRVRDFGIGVRLVPGPSTSVSELHGHGHGS